MAEIKDIYFSPSFGNRPKELLGREEIVNQFNEGLVSPPGSSERALLLLGQRGSGKTVLLLEMSEIAKEKGYVVASPTITSAGMLDRIIEKIQDEGERYIKSRKKKISGGSIGAFGFSAGLQFTAEDSEKKSFAFKLSKLCEALGAQGKGVLILVDEIQGNNEELRQLVIAYQEMVGEGRNIAVVMAGLPGAVSSLLNDHVLTFLNRATKITLDPIDAIDVESYYIKSFKNMQISMSDKEIRTAVSESKGWPYLVQLIGHYIVKYGSNSGEITEKEVDRVIELAKEKYVNDICDTVLNSLSEADVKVLRAISEDDGNSNVSDLAQRLDVSGNYIQKYKKRLIASGVIEQVRRGEVTIVIPYLREYLSKD